MHPGREDPRFSGRRTPTGGWQRGSLTVADSRADWDTGGIERRPLRRREIPQFQGHRLIDLVVMSGSRSGALRRKELQKTGEHCSRVCVPPSLIAAQVENGATRGWDQRLRKQLADAPNRTASGR
jgi:hypothetical protein